MRAGVCAVCIHVEARRRSINLKDGRRKTTDPDHYGQLITAKLIKASFLFLIP